MLRDFLFPVNSTLVECCDFLQGSSIKDIHTEGGRGVSVGLVLVQTKAFKGEGRFDEMRTYPFLVGLSSANL